MDVVVVGVAVVYGIIVGVLVVVVVLGCSVAVFWMLSIEILLNAQMVYLHLNKTFLLCISSPYSSCALVQIVLA